MGMTLIGAPTGKHLGKAIDVWQNKGGSCCIYHRSQEYLILVEDENVNTLLQSLQQWNCDVLFIQRIENVFNRNWSPL